MRGPLAWIVAACWAVAFWVTGCTQPAATPIAPPTPERIEIPVTVEVTRVVTQSVVVVPTAQPPEACAPAALAATEVITVGAILPLSLPGAMNAGFSMQVALNLAVHEINTRGGVHGIPLHLITYDSQGRPELGAHYATRLILDDCAVGLVGLYHNSVAHAALEVAHAYGVPVLVAEAADDALTAGELPQVFRLAPTLTMLAEAPAAWLAEVGDYNGNGAVTAALIVDPATHAQFAGAMAAAFAQQQITVTTLTVDLPAADFSPTIARIVAQEGLPDALLILVKGSDGLALAAQLLAAGIGPQKSTLLVLPQTALDDALFWQTIPDGTGIVAARSGPWPSTVNARGAEFAAAYGQYTKRWPDASAFAAYDSVYLLADAVARAETLQGPALVVALEAADIDLAAGRYSFRYGSQNPPGSVRSPSSLWHQWLSAQILYLQYTTPNQPAAEMDVLWPPDLRSASGPNVR